MVIFCFKRNTKLQKKKKKKNPVSKLNVGCSFHHIMNSGIFGNKTFIIRGIFRTLEHSNDGIYIPVKHIVMCFGNSSRP